MPHESPGLLHGFGQLRNAFLPEQVHQLLFDALVLVMEWTGLFVVALVQAHDAVGKALVFAKGLQHIPDRLCFCLAGQVKASVGTFGGKDHIFLIELLQDLGGKWPRRVDAGGNVIDTQLFFFAAFLCNQDRCPQGILTRFGKHKIG